MTFEKAVAVVKDYAAGYLGADLGLLDGLISIQAELSYCSEDEDAEKFVTWEQEMAYHIVCCEMSKLF